MANYKWMAALAYLFTIVSGLIVLLLSKDKYDKFHAVQALLTGIALLILAPLGLRVGGVIYALLVTLMAWKALNGEKFKLPLIGDWAEKYS